MILSRQNLISGAVAIAAFSVGGFLALHTSKTNPDVDLDLVLEALRDRPIQTFSNQTSAPQASKSGLLASDATQSPRICNQQCLADVAKVQAWSANVGRDSDGGLDKADEYAAYIRERPALRDQLIRMAQNQSDSDFSKLLVASFRYLETQDKMDLSQALMTSPEWAIRRKTISLLTKQDVLATQDEASIISLISNETDQRVAVPILRALGQSDVVRDKPEIIAYINERVAYTQDPKIRGAALVAQTKLTLDTATELPTQVLDSLLSPDPDYIAGGLQATDLILSHLAETGSDTNSPAFLKAEQVLEGLIYSDYIVLPEHVLQKADQLYLRYFD